MPEPDDKVPFLACLRHETKKTFWPYVLFVSKVIDLLAALGIVFFLLVSGMDIITAIVNAIADVIVSAIRAGWNITLAVISGFWYIISFIPWWGYLVFGLVALIVIPPVIYATGVCIQRRYSIDVARTAIVTIMLYLLAIGIVYSIAGIFIFMASCNVYPPSPVVPDISDWIGWLLIFSFALGSMFMIMWASEKTTNGKQPYELGAGKIAGWWF